VSDQVSSHLAVDRDALYRRVTAKILPILFIAYVVANLDRNNVGFAKLQFVRELGFSEAAYGLGAGMFYLGYLLFELPSNLFLARFGVRYTFLRIMMLWFVCCAGFAFMGQAWHYHLLRFTLGAAEAGLFPGVLLYMTFWMPRARRARFTALFMCAIPVSGMIGGPMAGLIMQQTNGLFAVAGWRWLFIAEAIPAAVMAFVVYRWLDNGPDEATWLSASDRRVIADDLATEHGLAEGNHVHIPSLSASLTVLRNPPLYLFGAMGFALIAGLNGLNLWGPTIIRQTGVHDLLMIGLISTVPQIVGMAAQLINAWHSDRTQERRLHAAIPAALAAIAWMLLPIADGNVIASVGLLMAIAGGLFAATGPFWSMPSQFLAGPSAAAGIALVTTLGGFGGFVSPAIVGWLTQRSGSLAAGNFYYGAVILVGIAAMWIATTIATVREQSNAAIDLN
jgi:sugar phosphate permease